MREIGCKITQIPRNRQILSVFFLSKVLKNPHLCCFLPPSRRFSLDFSQIMCLKKQFVLRKRIVFMIEALLLHTETKQSID